jgi:two-component system NtrC family sensor kinase
MNESKIDEYKTMLIERNKELRCLYKMSEIIEQHDSGINQVLTKIVKIIPQAMQFPEKTHAKIKINNIVYTSKSFQEFDIISEILSTKEICQLVL